MSCRYLGGSIVGQGCQRSLDGRYIRIGWLDEQIDILRCPNETMKNDCEATDQQVTRTLQVQGTAEGEEVFEKTYITEH